MGLIVLRCERCHNDKWEEENYPHRKFADLVLRSSPRDPVGLYVCHECGGPHRGTDKMTDKIKRPDEALAALGELFRNRNAVYGSTYKDFGRVMLALMPGETVLRTEQDWNRIGLFFHCADKLARYGRQFKNGGHPDSLDDNSVYSQMLQEYDAECKLSGGRSEKHVLTVEEMPSFNHSEPKKFYVGGGSVWAEDGQLYWVQARNGCLPFIAEYRIKNNDRSGKEAGLAWWTMNHREVIMTDEFRVISWVQRPNLKE